MFVKYLSNALARYFICSISFDPNSPMELIMLLLLSPLESLGKKKKKYIAQSKEEEPGFKPGLQFLNIPHTWSKYNILHR
jgi:hypothetical protein